MYPDKLKKLCEIFTPYAEEHIAKLNLENKRLAYYTSAESAMKIMDNSEIWMRNISGMNDFTEVKQGIKILSKNLLHDSDNYKKFKEALKGFKIDVENILDRVLKKLFQSDTGEYISWQYSTYISCFTEHDIEKEKNGKLSMWRVYGNGNNGVAECRLIC